VGGGWELVWIVAKLLILVTGVDTRQSAALGFCDCYS